MCINLKADDRIPLAILDRNGFEDRICMGVPAVQMDPPPPNLRDAELPAFDFETVWLRPALSMEDGTVCLSLVAPVYASTWNFKVSLLTV